MSAQERGREGEAVCQDVADYSTLVGPRYAVERVRQDWWSLRTPDRFGVEPPEQLDLAELDPGGDAFLDGDSPAVAVVRHRRGAGFALAAGLQADLLVGGPGIPPTPEVLVEPGHAFTAAQGGRGPTVTLTPAKRAQALRSAPAVPPPQRAAGSRVALLDTGLLTSAGTMADFTGARAATVGPDDPHGHGTAVAELIRAVNPAARITPVRVLDEYGQGRSYEVLGGLAYALWSGEFDVVNASLQASPSGRCETSLGRSLDYVLAICRARSGRPLPVLVAAAGNDPTVAPRYPAILPDAVVAVALDGSGNPAGYNTPAPGTATVWGAYGGEPGDAMGDISRPGLAPEPLWGTSLAAGIVTGAYLS